MAGRRIVVGDLHGCYDELIELLEKIGIGDDDRVICVGDLITKGPKSKEVLELFMTDARFSTVIGNHDLALRRKWNGEDIELKAAQKEAHKELRGEKDAYASFFNRMPFTIDLGTHLVVHAGLRPNVELYSQTTGDLTRMRTLDRIVKVKTELRGITSITEKRSSSSDTGLLPSPVAAAKPSVSTPAACTATT